VVDNDNVVDFGRVEEVPHEEANNEDVIEAKVVDEIIFPTIPAEYVYDNETVGIRDVPNVQDDMFIMPSRVLRRFFGFNTKSLKALLPMDFLTQAMFLVFKECFKLTEVQKLGQSIASVDPTISKTDDYKKNLFMDIEPDELENYLKFDQDGADNPEVMKTIKQMERTIRNYTQVYYIKNKKYLFAYHPGILEKLDPDMLDMQEIGVLETLLGKFFTSSNEIGKSISNASSLSGLEYTFKDMSVSTRKKLELLKIGLINENGYTEESVDAYIKACIEYTKKSFDEGKYNVREEAKYDTEGAKDAAKLLVKDEEWQKHFEETGEKLQKYSTEMFNKIVEHDTKPIEDYIAEEGEQELNKPAGELIKLMNQSKESTFKNGLQIMLASEGRYYGSDNQISKSVDRSDKPLSYAEKRKAKREKALLENKEIEVEDKEVKEVIPPKPEEDKFAKFKEKFSKQEEERKEKEVEEKEYKETKGYGKYNMHPETHLYGVIPKGKVVESLEELKEDKEEKVVLTPNPYTFDNKDTNAMEIELRLKELEIEKLRLQLELQKSKQTVVVETPVKASEPKEDKVDYKASIVITENENGDIVKTDTTTIVDNNGEEFTEEEVEELKHIEDLNKMENMSIEELTAKIRDAVHKELSTNGRDAYGEFPVIKTDPDTSILRTVSNPLQRIKLYEASAKEGRKLFMPNSGYEVFIKKIRDKDQISYLLTMLDPKENLTQSVDQLIMDECINILYANMEFEFEEPVSREDFLKCTHPNDIIFAIMMLAIVNLPVNKDGKCLVNISSVTCNSEYHGNQRQIFSLTHPLQIDILEEFAKIYKLSQPLLERKSKFDNGKYKSISEAYEQNGSGVYEYCSIKDDIVTYNLILSPLNLYKINKQKEETQKILYDSLRSDFKSEGAVRASLEARIGRDFSKVEIYMDNTPFDMFKADTLRVSGMRLEDFSATFSEIEDETLRKEALKEQALNKETFKCLTHILPLMAEYAENIDYAMVIINFVDSLEVVANATGERIAGPISHSNYPELLQIFTQIPDIKGIGEAIERLNDKTNLVIEDTAIEWNSKDIFRFMPRFEDLFAPEEKYRELLKNEGESEVNIEKYVQEYTKQKENMHSGKCFCGSDKLVLDWRSILFQCLSKV
jgi:hypothetical protein